jgi:DNA mismatch repair ATPase MutS
MFLYKLVQGVSHRSFGLNVARLAQLPPSVVDAAAAQAARLEQQTNEVRAPHHTPSLPAPTGSHGARALCLFPVDWVDHM